MTINRKPDEQVILQHLESLEQQPWLGKARQWWPKYVFRVDNVVAVSKILKSGRLLSRALASREGLIGEDSASPTVIAATADRWKEYARLYFRPRTPTQHESEGFRPTTAFRLGGAHCPAPVVMLFDARDILTRAETVFSDGNLAANPSTGNTASFLKSIPFEKVYHDRWLDDSNKRSIIYHRNAEVIFPNELDLLGLQYIGCRTQAEYETLLYLLPPPARKQWSSIIGLGLVNK